MTNRYLQEVSVLDLERMVWIETRRYDGHCGTYRSIAVSRPVTVYPASEISAVKARRSSVASSVNYNAANPSLEGISSTSTAGTINSTNGPAVQPRTSSRPNSGELPSLIQLSYSATPTKESPEPIWLFSNFSFANVKRALDMISAPRAPNFACPVTHLSHLMSPGPNLPPGLR